MTLTEEQVRDIAQEFDLGNRCFWHTETGEFLFIPADAIDGKCDPELFQDDIKKLRKNIKFYREIERMRSRDSFLLMEEFAEELTDNPKLQTRLFNALGQRKPFRGFKDIIDDSGDYREMWFNFKSQKLEDWVREKSQEPEPIDPDIFKFR